MRERAPAGDTAQALDVLRKAQPLSGLAGGPLMGTARLGWELGRWGVQQMAQTEPGQVFGDVAVDLGAQALRPYWEAGWQVAPRHMMAAERVAGALSRSPEQALGEVMGLPAVGVESLLGRAASGRLARQMRGLREAERVVSPAAERVRWLGPAPATPWRGPAEEEAARYEAAPQVRAEILERYGDTPQARRAVTWAESMAYSGPQAMLQAAARIAAGGDPYGVLYGQQVNLWEPSEQDQQALAARLRAAVEAGEDPTSVLQQIQQTGFIPGEANILAEMAGQSVLDPLNLPVAEWLGFFGKGRSLGQAADDWTRAGRFVADDLVRGADEAEALARAVGAGE
jgi:hypothetical protein